MIKYKCGWCKAKLETADSFSGGRETCPACKKENPVPLSNLDLKEQKNQKEESERVLADPRTEEQKRKDDAPSQSLQPNYFGTMALMVIFVVIGGITILIGLGKLLSDQDGKYWALALVLAGIGNLAVAAGLRLLIDIAENTWWPGFESRQRHNQKR